MDGKSQDDIDQAWEALSDPPSDVGHGGDHGHSHPHSHQLPGSWETWLQHSVLRVILGALAVVAVVSVLALAMLWPDGSGREFAEEQAIDSGLNFKQFDARIVSVSDEICPDFEGNLVLTCRSYAFVPESGPDAGAVVVDELVLGQAGFTPQVSAGDEVIYSYDESLGRYHYEDKQRSTPLLLLLALFAVVVIALGRLRGAFALLSMVVTVAVLFAFVVPSVLDGNNPILVCAVGASVVAYLSLFLTHGWNPTTTVALAGTLAALALTLGVSWVFFNWSDFAGNSGEYGLILPLLNEEINISALLLGGAIIGALGAVDDVTVTQVATVAELKRADPSMGMTKLVTAGIRVGREHIASTVNTLLLAYAGASMPLLLSASVLSPSFSATANSEEVAIEIVRTLCGSVGLVAAVPLTTFLAAVLVVNSPKAMAAAE